MRSLFSVSILSISTLLVSATGASAHESPKAATESIAAAHAASVDSARVDDAVSPDDSESPIVASSLASEDDNEARPHTLGLGGRAGGFSFGVGASLRYWTSGKWGVQADVSHYGVAGLGILQMAPSVLVGLGHPDLTKDTQIRGYAGGGVNFFRVSESGFGASLSDTGVGGQGFVGAEAVFKQMPRLGVSGDIGYYTTGDFFGASVGGFALALSGHYYFK